MEKHGDILITRRITDDFRRSHGLIRILTPTLLWAFGVGTALTGSFARVDLGTGYFGSLGLMTVGVIYSFIYVVYAFIVSELAVYFPYAGGSYAYARRALGRFGGYFAGSAAVLEFNCAAAVVLVLFKDFITPFLPASMVLTSVGAVILLIILGHCFSIQLAAGIQLFFTGTVVSGVILFFLGSYEAVQAEQIVTINNGFTSWKGVFQALPYVIWLYLGFESMATAAEETKNPGRVFPQAIVQVALTLVVLNLTILYFSSRSVVWGSLSNAHYPLLAILNRLHGEDMVLSAVFSAIVVCALLAGINGLMNGYSRQVYALSRAAYFPRGLSRLHRRFRTPYPAIIFSGLMVLLTAYTLPLKNIVLLAVLSVVVHHIMIFISFARIMKIEPELFCQWKRLNYSIPLFLALGLSVAFLGIILWFGFEYLRMAVIVYGIVLANYYFVHNQVSDEAPEESMATAMERNKKVNIR